MISIVVPVFNEEGSVLPLVEAVRDAMRDWREDWELLLVDDGSDDDTPRMIASCVAVEPRVRLIRLARNYGQSAAMQAGFDHARGSLIVTMDGDLQNDPRDIPLLVSTLGEGFDLVAGFRERRRDPLITRRVPSWLANRLLRFVTGIPIRDTGCTLKVFRREVVDELRLYSDLHRFIPALAFSVAGARIGEVPVRHHPRRFGRSKYGMSRAGKVLADLLILAMLRGVQGSPLRLFALLGITALLVSLAVGALALATAWGWFEAGSVVVLVVIAASWLALGGFLIMTGLIAESFVHQEGGASQVERKLIRGWPA